MAMGKLPADPHPTEVEAAERVGVTLRQTQADVLEVLTRFGPSNDDRIRLMLGLQGHTVSKSGPATRRSELVDLGVVRKLRDASGNVVTSLSDVGGTMTVWEVVPEGERRPPRERRPSTYRRLMNLRRAMGALADEFEQDGFGGLARQVREALDD